MNELYILRHCKSDWGRGLSSDSDRPLSSRGIRDAGRMGDWMMEHRYLPKTVLCSTALRTRQTAQLVCERLDIDEQYIRFEETLYLASRKTLLDIIQSNLDKPSPLMLIGHNPGMDEIVSYLSKVEVPRTGQGKLMTTGCLVRFSLPGNVSELQHQAELLSITRPSEIL